MMQCNKTGLTDKDWKTLIDVVNVYDPNDIAHVYPRMGTPEFMQDVTTVFKKLLKYTNSESYKQSYLIGDETQDVQSTKSLDSNSLTEDIAYQQYIHSLS